MLVPACASPPEPLSSAAIDPDHLKTLAWIKNLKIFLYLQDLLASALPLHHPPWQLQTQDKKYPDFKFRLTSSLGSHFFFSLGKDRVHTEPSTSPHPAEHVGLVQPALALSRSSEVLELQATDQLSPSCESVHPFFA